MEIVFVRHGQTNSNIEHRYLGWTDISLNEKGIEQVKTTRDRLTIKEFDVIYVSPLLRTIETSDILTNCKKDIIFSEDLKERNFGIFENMKHDEIFDKYPEEYKKWTSDWVNHKIKDGESAYDSFERNRRFVNEEILNSNADKILVITHLGCIRNFISLLLNFDVESTWRFTVDNGSITTVNINDGYAFLTGLSK